MKNTVIALLLSTGMSLLFLALYGLMNIPGFYDGYCRFFGIASTLCSLREALVRGTLFFAMCFTFFRVSLIIDTVMDKRKGKKGAKDEDQTGSN